VKQNRSFAVLVFFVILGVGAAPAYARYRVAANAEAGKSYEHNPIAFHLRAMNMLYEGLKENATIVIVPSTAVESMQLGGLAGMTALSMGLGQERANGHKDGEIKKQMDDTAHVEEILNRILPKTSP